MCPCLNKYIYMYIHIYIYIYIMPVCYTFPVSNRVAPSCTIQRQTDRETDRQTDRQKDRYYLHISRSLSLSIYIYIHMFLYALTYIYVYIHACMFTQCVCGCSWSAHLCGQIQRETYENSALRQLMRPRPRVICGSGV